jgi:hypothetical protein
LLYDAILVLHTGEIRYINNVITVSLTRARVIITNEDDEGELFRAGEVKKIELTAKGDKL